MQRRLVQLKRYYNKNCNVGENKWQETEILGMAESVQLKIGRNLKIQQLAIGTPKGINPMANSKITKRMTNHLKM